MPVATTYPGVYIQELPSGVHTIVGVSTSTTAFVGRAAKGPIDEPTVITSFEDYQRIFGGLSLLSAMSFAVRDFFQNGGGKAVIVRLSRPGLQVAQDVAAAGVGVDADAVAKAIKDAAAVYTKDPEKTIAEGIAKAAKDAAVPGATKEAVQKAAADAASQTGTRRATIDANGLALEAVSDGAWANGLQARVEEDPKDKANRFKLLIRDSASGAIEVYPNASIVAGDPSGRNIDRLLEQSQLVRATALPAALPAAHGAPVFPKGVWDANTPATFSGVADAKLADDGAFLTSADIVGAGHQTAKTGLYALRKTDLFNLLCIPPYKADASIDEAIIDEAAQYCQARRAMFIIDPPPVWPVLTQAGAGQIRNIGSPTSYAAVFYPRLVQPNPLRDGQEEAFAPCGAIAGIFARTDAQRGVWKAPAGLEAVLSGVPRLAVNLSDGENGQLNPLGVNCLRNFPGAGRVVWGARTREGDDRGTSEWKYIPVRRMALFIEESLYRGTQWVVFEPNAEPLWAQIRLNIGAFMQSLFRQGAFQGKTPLEAYLVKCDASTTTQNDIDRGVVNIVVGFAPLKPAEFVVIRLQQMAGQLEV
jgi:uncharacterized protein